MYAEVVTRVASGPEAARIARIFPNANLLKINMKSSF
jgi:hypothetical protein